MDEELIKTLVDMHFDIINATYALSCFVREKAIKAEVIKAVNGTGADYPFSKGEIPMAAASFSDVYMTRGAGTHTTAYLGYVLVSDNKVLELVEDANFKKRTLAEFIKKNLKGTGSRDRHEIDAAVMERMRSIVSARTWRDSHSAIPHYELSRPVSNKHLLREVRATESPVLSMSCYRTELRRIEKITLDEIEKRIEALDDDSIGYARSALSRVQDINNLRFVYSRGNYAFRQNVNIDGKWLTSSASLPFIIVGEKPPKCSFRMEVSDRSQRRDRAEFEPVIPQLFIYERVA